MLMVDGYAATYNSKEVLQFDIAICEVEQGHPGPIGKTRTRWMARPTITRKRQKGQNICKKPGAHPQFRKRSLPYTHQDSPPKHLVDRSIQIPYAKPSS